MLGRKEREKKKETSNQSRRQAISPDQASLGVATSLCSKAGTRGEWQAHFERAENKPLLRKQHVSACLHVDTPACTHTHIHPYAHSHAHRPRVHTKQRPLCITAFQSVHQGESSVNTCSLSFPSPPALQSFMQVQLQDLKAENLTFLLRAGAGAPIAISIQLAEK